jgi:hypothetical protein
MSDWWHEVYPRLRQPPRVAIMYWCQFSGCKNTINTWIQYKGVTYALCAMHATNLVENKEALSEYQES